MPKVKICCIQSVAEAHLAIETGADAIGLVGPMPSGPGIVDLKIAAEIIQKVPSTIDTFLLSSKTTTKEIVKEHDQAPASTIQLVDHVPFKELERIRKMRPGITLVQVIHVMNTECIQAAIDVAPYVDMILLDSGNPALTIKKLGGTGRVHNWAISRKIRERVSTPVFLAGGIKSDNVQNAIKKVNPYGIDLCSGVRADGKLNELLLKEFFTFVNAAH